MGKTVASVVIDIAADTAKLVDGMNRAERYAKTSMQRIKNTLGAMAAAFASFKGFELFADGAKALVQTASEFERFETVLRTIEGSSAKAESSMRWIEKFTSTTPYQLGEVTKSFVKLRAYGLDPTDGLLRTLGDTASAMGKNIEDAVEAIADAVVGENERLKEFGIKAAKQGDRIAYSWTDASGRAKHIIVENNSAIIESTLTAIFNSKYAGAMEQQSQTFAGMVSNMSDNWTLFKKRLMDAGAFDYLKAAMKTMADTLRGVYDNTLQNTDAFTEGVIESFDWIIRAAGNVMNAFEGIGIFAKTAWKVIVVAFDAIAGSVLKATEKIIDAINLLPGMNLDNSWSKNASEALFSDMEETLNSIDHVLDGVKDYSRIAEDFIKKTKKNFVDLKDTIGESPKQGTVLGAIDGAFKGFSAGAKEAGKSTKSMSKTMVESATYASSSMADAMQQNFFDYMTGRFRSFKDFFKNLLNDILSNIVTPFAKALSGSISGALAGVFGGASYAMAAPDITTELTKAGFSAIGDGVFQSTNGTKVITDGAAILGAYGADGSPVSLSGVFNGGFASNIGGGFSLGSIAYLPSQMMGSVAGSAYGIPVVGGYLGDFFSGGAALLSGGNAASIGTTQALGGAAVAGGLGYLGGSLLDGLFGKDTYADVGGGIGAAVGSLFGPVGALLGGLGGSVIGGIFGKKRTTDTGIQFTDDAYAGNIDTVAYQDWKKSGWFSSSSGTNITALSESDIRAIDAVFKAYDYIFYSLGDFDKKVQIAAGKYSGQSFEKVLAKDFLAKFMDVPKTITETTEKTVIDWWTYAIETTTVEVTKENPELDRVYKIWEDYAKELDTSVTEAIAQAFDDYIQTTRSFDIWLSNFYGDTTEALKKQYEYAQRDLDALMDSMGVDVTIDNYLQQYEAALKASPDPYTIQQWDQLGKLLQDAAEAEKAYNDALQSTVDAISYTVDVSRYADEYNRRTMDSVEYAAVKLQESMTKVEKIEQALGVSGVTFDNYLDTVSDLNGLTKEQADLWAQLGDALMGAQESLKSYADEISAEAAEYERALRILSEDDTKTWEDLERAIDEGVTPENLSDMLSAAQQLRDNEIAAIEENYNARIAALEEERSALTEIYDYAGRLLDQAESLRNASIESTAFFEGMYYAALNNVDYDPTQENIDKLVEYSGLYADKLAEEAKSGAEYRYAMAKMANELDDLGIKTQYTTKDAADKISSEVEKLGFDMTDAVGNATATYEQSVQKIEAALEKSYNEYIDGQTESLEPLLGESSPIVQWLQIIASSIGTIGGEAGAIPPIPSSDSTAYSSATSYVTSAYDALLGRDPDPSGLSYWSGGIVDGSVSSDKLGVSMVAAAYDNGEIDSTALVSTLYEYGLGRAPDDGGLSYWSDQVESGAIDPGALADTFAAAAEENGEKFRYFADGGLVTGPVAGIVGEAGPELVIPLDRLGESRVPKLLESIDKRLERLEAIERDTQPRLVRNTEPSRWEESA